MQTIQQHIDATATAPRVTPADVEAYVDGCYYFTAQDGVVMHADQDTVPNNHDQALGLLTFCVLVLKNGFTVTGESACVSVENFNADIGRRIAREHAVAKVWPLLGFRLCDLLMYDAAIAAAEAKPA